MNDLQGSRLKSCQLPSALSRRRPILVGFQEAVGEGVPGSLAIVRDHLLIRFWCLFATSCGKFFDPVKDSRIPEGGRHNFLTKRLAKRVTPADQLPSGELTFNQRAKFESLDRCPVWLFCSKNRWVSIPG